ncbi:TetR/AcrR family transcriptional regulator [Pseudonocardia parietis]|uniref:AcrR family transcriptional regulator n=1 Tax=Pseudonocardia parietis TaxID=570936 RepID=A0ABS4VYL2_9PSEU|nr:TetR/AcrR family transcriptional regulator [Pseudonocardia parietis]MBP2369037.1 AcrR family transcriptional regulator [Pseudonocardia parietis]
MGTGPRRRGAALVEALHTAALDELDEVGLGRLTMDGIARRAGTARTTLYRRWADPGELLLDAVGTAYPVETPSPHGDDLRGDLIRSLELLVRWARHPSARAVQAILAERRAHPELAARLDELFDASGRRFTATVLAHHVRAGHIDPARVTPLVENIGEAMVIKHWVDVGREPDREHLVAIVDQLILPVLDRRPSTRSPQT